MKKIVLIFLIFFGKPVMSDELPYRESVLEIFSEKEVVLEKLYTKFRNDKKINIMHFQSSEVLAVSDDLFGPRRKYKGWSEKKYWKLRNEAWPIKVPLLVRESNNISSTIATALKHSAFIEVELNLYNDSVEIRDTCKNLNFSEKGECLVPVVKQWALRYVWTPD